MNNFLSINGSATALPALEAEIAWLYQLMESRLHNYLNEKPFVESLLIGPIHEIDTPFGNFLAQLDLKVSGRILFALSLACELDPEMLSRFFNSAPNNPILGAVDGTVKGERLPTLRTAAFVISGKSPIGLAEISKLMSGDHPLFSKGVVDIIPPVRQGSFQSSTFKISKDILHYLLTGKELKPSFNNDFPAKKIQTNLDWEDLILSAQTTTQIEEIKAWLDHGDMLMQDWGMNKKLKPGFKCLFYGPPGTGKTLTASLLGKSTGREVYRVDLSLVVSKYIGETEKNLGKIFDRAENKDWILFFDEADALFGKRGKVSDSRDRYANQEVSFLLQRVEEFNGLVILASNMKSNMDDAFLRRFQSMIYFPLPQAEQRLNLWKKALPEKAGLGPDVSLTNISKQYKLAGGSIMNVIRYVCLSALQKGDGIITQADILKGIKKELSKEGKSLTR